MAKYSGDPLNLDPFISAVILAQLELVALPAPGKDRARGKQFDAIARRRDTLLAELNTTQRANLAAVASALSRLSA